MAKRSQLPASSSLKDTYLWIAILLGSGITFLAAAFSLTGDRPSAKSPQEVAITDLSNRADAADKSLGDLQQRLDAITSASNDIGMSAQIADVKQQLAIVQAKQALLDEALLSTPERSLQVPLLAKDVSALRNDLTKETSDNERSLDRMYTTIYWLLGAAAFAGIGNFGLSIVQIRRRSTMDDVAP
jgi:hypothetical protein